MTDPHIFEAQVRDISLEGYGVIDDPNGGVVFCLGVYPGDMGRFEVIKKKDRYGFARLLELLRPAKERITPPCPHSGMGPGLCGGCPWMSLDYATQLLFKSRRLHHNLLRLGLVDNSAPAPEVIPAKNIYHFRNRAQFKTDGIQLGYVSRFSRSLAPIKDCIALNEKMRELLKGLLAQLPKPEWAPTEKYIWSYIEVDENSEPEEIKANLRRPFMQANSEQNEEMKAWLWEQIKDLPQDSRFLELFCGSGNFTTLLLKKQFAQLVAVDIASDGIQQLQDKQLSGLHIQQLNLFKPSDWKQLKASLPKADYLLLDPPRDGFEKLYMFAQQWGLPKRIFYISCDLNTFVRDAWLLKKKGYYLKSIKGLDQFPHTPHLEILSVLELEGIGPTKLG